MSHIFGLLGSKRLTSGAALIAPEPTDRIAHRSDIIGRDCPEGGAAAQVLSQIVQPAAPAFVGLRRPRTALRLQIDVIIAFTSSDASMP